MGYAEIAFLRLRISGYNQPSHYQEAQRLVGIFVFWRQHIPHLGLFLWPIYQVTQKDTMFKWDLD